MKIKIGVIGVGRIGSQWDEGVIGYPPRTHVGAILQAEKFQLCAVCDTNVTNLARFADDWKLHIPLYDSVSIMLKEQPFDVISVVVPTVAHYPVLKEVMKCKPKVVFCEKPFCGDMQEADEIYRLSKELNVVFSVNYHRRWDEKIRKLKIHTDALTVPCHVNVLYKKGLFNYGSHMVNLLLYLFGSVKSVFSEPLSSHQQKINDPSISSILNFQSGLQVTMKGLDDVSYELFDLDVFYPGEKLHLEMGGYVIDRYKAVNDLYFRDYTNLSISENMFSRGPVHGLTGAYKEIEDYILHGFPCNVNNAETAIQTLKILEAIKASAQNNRLIYL